MGRVWIVVAIVATACGHRAPVPPAEHAAPAATMSPPVTVDEFRAAFPVGTTILVRYERLGGPPVESRWTWTAVDAEGGTIAALSCDSEGRVITDEGETRARWTELMGHAIFPADRTFQTFGAVDVPAGHFETWHYTVNDTTPEGRGEITQYHFDRTLPGPPVLMFVEQDGVEVMRMELVDRDVGPPSPRRCTL